MEEYIKILEEMEKDIVWHLFQCKRGAIYDIPERLCGVSRLKTVKKLLDIVLEEVEFQISDDF